MSNFENIRNQFERSAASSSDHSSSRGSSARSQPQQPQQPPQVSHHSSSSSSTNASPMDPRDEAVANQYKQRLRQGIPSDVVMKEMIDHSVEPHIMSKVLAYDPSLSSHPDDDDNDDYHHGDEEAHEDHEPTENDYDDNDSDNENNDNVDETNLLGAADTADATQPPFDNNNESDEGGYYTEESFEESVPSSTGHNNNPPQAMPEPSENYEEDDPEVSNILQATAAAPRSTTSSQSSHGSRKSAGSRASSRASYQSAASSSRHSSSRHSSSRHSTSQHQQSPHQRPPSRAGSSSSSSAPQSPAQYNATGAYFGSTTATDPFAEPQPSPDPFASDAAALQPLGAGAGLGIEAIGEEDEEEEEPLPSYDDTIVVGAGGYGLEDYGDEAPPDSSSNVESAEGEQFDDEEGFSSDYAQGGGDQDEDDEDEAYDVYGAGGLDPAYQQNSYYGTDPEQARTEEDLEKEDEQERRRKMYLWLILCGIVLLIVAVVLVVLIALLVRSDDDDGGASGRGGVLNGTTAPTASMAPSQSPAPSMSPTSGPMDSIQLTAVQDIERSSSSQHGTAVQISGNWVAISSPPLNRVETFARPQLRADYQPDQVLTGPSAGSDFGADLAFSSVVAANPFLAVSAPQEPMEGSSTPAGAVYFYAYNRGDAQWIREGTQMTGGTTGAHNNERFGESIAISDTYIVIAGAPGYGATDIGRVYTFTFEHLGGTDFDWVPRSSTQMVGSVGNGQFGSSVDITRDGNTIVAGEPGASSFRIYDWADDDWSLSYELALPEAEDLGSEVVCLSSDYVAVGAPSANNGAGIVFAFERTNSTWSQIGQVEGSAGQGLGASGTLSGREGANGPQLVVGTKTGEVMRFDSDGLVRRFRSGSGRTPSAPVTQLDISNDGVFSVIVGFGSRGSVTIFEEGNGLRNNPIDPPTASPTATPVALDWQLVTSPSLEFGEANTDFGFAVSSAGDMVAVGLPRYSSRLGAVETLERNGNSFPNRDLVTNNITEEFGSSIDMAVLSDGSTIGMLVGATDSDGATFVSAFGTAHYYEKSGSGQWTEIGSELRGGENLVQGGGKQGQTVAMASQIRRIAVAAPDSSVNGTLIDTGMVFTYEYNTTQNDWAPLADPLIGGAADDFMGTGLDMSADGSRLLVGSPGDGTAGKVEYLTWASGSWVQLESVQGSGEEMLGTTATILTSTGSQFAVGGPGFGSGRGIIRVFSQNSPNGPFNLLGSPIVGESDEQIGQTLCGENGRIAFGTALGSFRAYEYSNGDWQQLGSSQSTGSPVASIAMNNNTIYVGLDNEEVRAYDLVLA